MKVVVACVVYDRFSNIVELIRSWNMCDTSGAELVIIHNYANEEAKDAYSKFCLEAGINYVPRENIGFDIGRLQDVCLNRLPGFPEFDYLIWLTDDCVIMRKDFIQQFISQFKPDVGCVAMEISREVKLHIRTTGFCIPKHVAQRLTFPSNPIKTKEHCYLFEHRDRTNTFLQQINRMGLKAIQISRLEVSPFWDSGHKRTKSRLKEHYDLFPKPAQSNAKVAFICPIYNSYPEILSSLINQTHQNWHLFLVHDGPATKNIKAIVEAANDPRVEYIETETRVGSWGFPIRRDYLQKLKDTDFDYVVITNSDNHHTPNYCEAMIKGFTGGQVAIYHAQMVHNYIGWGVIDCRLQQGFLDCGGVMIKKDVAVEVGWNDVKSHSSDWIFFSEIIKKYGAHRFGKVPGCLLIHN